MRNTSHSVVALLLFVAIIGAYAVMAIWFPLAYIQATYEDLYGEWAQTLFFACALVFSAVLAIHRDRQRLFFALLAAACFYVVMEEISWGQRILGFATPEPLLRHNIQKEANIHNLFTGPVDTALKRTLEYLLAIAFAGYGLVYPLLLRLRQEWLQRLEARWLPAPPLYLAPYFLAAGYLELGYLNFNEAEIAEILIGAAMAILAVHYWLTGRNGLDAHRRNDWPAGVSSRLALLIVAVVACTGLLSAAATQLMYQAPDIRAGTDSRLLNGYEKFADRYMRYQRWEQAIDLYLMVHRAEPARTSVMRELADAYRNNGDIIGFNQYNQMALDALLAVQAKNPDKISTNLALAKTYRQRGIAPKTIEHLQRAHALAQQRFAANPGSAHEAYWLGKTYQAIGDLQNAYIYFRRAYEFKPSSSKYRKAYYSLKNGVDQEG